MAANDPAVRAEEHLGLVHLCANRFRSRGIEYEELYSAGCLGLVKAANAFDPARGVCFSTYAVPVILGEIRRLFREGGSGVLTIAGMPSVYAEFESLKLVGKPRPDVLTYSFAFRELMEERDDKRREIIAAENENLWDISYRFGIGIDTLVRLNPQVKRPDILTAGEVVRLC